MDKQKLWLAAGLLLAACSKPSDQAMVELEIIENSQDSKDEVCVATRKLADAYLLERDAKSYRIWKNYADTRCLLADLDRRLP